MRLFRIAASIALVCSLATTAMAKNEQVPTMYVFGFSASFNDSTVYITDIQTVDNAWVDGKTKFLVNRDDYAYQMNTHFENKGQQNRTCIVFYDQNKKKLEKKFEKIKKKYIGKDEYNVRYLSDKDFHFTAVAPDEIYINEAEEPEKKEKEEKDKKKDNRPTPPQGGTPPPGAPSGQKPPMMM